jgi:O-antigen/teichoic acid export membrane protein
LQFLKNNFYSICLAIILAVINQKMKDFLRKRLGGELGIMLKNGSLILSSNLFKALLNFIRSIVVARALGVDLLGTFALISAFSLFVLGFFDFTLSTAIIKFNAKHLNKNQDKFNGILKLGYLTIFFVIPIYLALIYAVLYFSYDTFFTIPDLQLYIYCFATISALALFDGFAQSLLRLTNNFKLEAMIAITISVIEFIFFVGAIFMYENSFSMFLVAVIISKILGFLLFNIITFRKISLSFFKILMTPLSVVEHEEKKAFVNFCTHNYLAKLCKNAVDTGDILLLGYFSTETQIGLFTIAKKLGKTVFIFVDPLIKSSFPQLSKLYIEKQFGEIKKLIVSFLKLLIIPAVVGTTIAFFFAGTLIEIAYGGEFLGATPIFSILLVSFVIQALFFWTLPLLWSMGLANYRLYINFTVMAIGVPLSVYFIPNYLGIGAAIVVLIIQVIRIFFFTFTSWSRLNFDIVNSLGSQQVS